MGGTYIRAVQGSKALGKRNARSPRAIMQVVRLAGEPLLSFSFSRAVKSNGKYCSQKEEG